MCNHSEMLDTLNNILKSETFSKSTTAKVLLKFLVECTVQDKEISAFSIGIELFGKKYDPEKSDVNIRVNISHLRKRLKRYYEQEGSEDRFIISIEPGQYKTSFSAKETLKTSSSKNKVILGGIIAIVAIVVIATALGTKPNNRVWNPIFSNGLETTLYLGDVFGYSGPTTFGNNGWHRDSKINSLEEFHAQSKKQPEKYDLLKPAEFSYVVFENSFNIKPFTQYFTLNDYDFSIRPASGFKTRSVKDRNTIYAGPLFVQSRFDELFNEFSNNVRLNIASKNYGKFMLKYKDGDKQFKFINVNSIRDKGEYALASGFNGPNNSRHYMFFSNHGMGLTAAVEYFTNADSVQAFSQRHLKNTDEFVALFFVKGKNRTSLSMELVFFDNNLLRHEK